MVRSSRAAATADDRARAGERLAALGLGRPASGWTPALSSVDLDPPPPTDGDVPLLRQAAPATTAPADLNRVESSGPAGPPPFGELARAWAIDRSPPWSHGVLGRLTGRAAAGTVLALVALVAAGVLLVRHHAAGPADPYQPSAGASVPIGQPSDPAPVASDAGSSIVVDVGGRVRKPGLVTLPVGARVADAIAAAGGPLHHRELATIDLAARVSDGQLLLIGVQNTSGTATDGTDSGGVDGSGGSPAPIGLNSATLDQLETLPGVGPVTAQKIIDWRDAHNGFSSVAQLQQVPGIGPARYAELSPLVTP
ncbi:MAG TPA: ComEA family DNA-binding protein [Mycobacteriales bacterium]|nr:ComEA family DNA-binding protein [Mycobacteriales bacterium]